MQAADSTPASLASWLRLQHTDGIGLLTAHALLARFGTPEAVFAAHRAQLLAVVGPAKADAVLAPPDPALAARHAAVLAWCAQPGNRVLCFGDGAYPALLRDIVAAPLLLYVRGRAELLGQDGVAVVGSRHASLQGRQTAERMAWALADAGLVIISGLALGIDAAAHAGGLRGAGSTVAVLGTGIDRIYPDANSALAQRIAEEGCLISEYALGTPPLRDNFPRRNRVISGLARGVLVVEAAAKSGSLITARLAAAQGRDVYAMPGSVHAALAKGCHQLIRAEGAKLVETVDDVLAELSMQQAARAGSFVGNGARSHFDDSFVDRVLVALGDTTVRAEELANLLGQPATALQAQLLALELAGLVERLPGGLYQRLQP